MAKLKFDKEKMVSLKIEAKYLGNDNVNSVFELKGNHRLLLITAAHLMDSDQAFRSVVVQLANAYNRWCEKQKSGKEVSNEN